MTRAAAAANPRASISNVRFTGIDGLRGIAAFMVCVGHLTAAATIKYPGILGIFPEIADIGRFGVQVFFVLSGFVIAHSVSDGVLSANYFGRFVGRRFVRLDIPYWSIIAGEIFLLWLSGHVMASYARELPPWQQIATNAFYMQEFFGYADLLPTFWTLCYEVQFYLAFVGSLVFGAWLTRSGVGSATMYYVKRAALYGSFLLSLLMFVHLVPELHKALFFDRWFQFLIGVMTYLYYRGKLPGLALVAACLCCVAAGGYNLYMGRGTFAQAFTVLTCVTIVGLMRGTAWLRMTLESRTLQFLGAISYSLYLTHLSLGWRVIVVVREMFGVSYSTAAAVFALIVGLAASVVAAYVFHRLIERPAMALSKRIDLPRNRPLHPPLAVPA